MLLVTFLLSNWFLILHSVCYMLSFFASGNSLGIIILYLMIARLVFRNARCLFLFLSSDLSFIFYVDSLIFPNLVANSNFNLQLLWFGLTQLSTSLLPVINKSDFVIDLLSVAKNFYVTNLIFEGLWALCCDLLLRLLLRFVVSWITAVSVSQYLSFKITTVNHSYLLESLLIFWLY